MTYLEWFQSLLDQASPCGGNHIADIVQAAALDRRKRASNFWTVIVEASPLAARIRNSGSASVIIEQAFSTWADAESVTHWGRSAIIGSRDNLGLLPLLKRLISENPSKISTGIGDVSSFAAAMETVSDGEFRRRALTFIQAFKAAISTPENLEVSDSLVAAIDLLWDNIPTQDGGPKLTKLLVDNAFTFRGFAEKFCREWVRAGLCPGGYGLRDDGLAAAIEAAHVVVAGRPIPAASDLLGDLRQPFRI